VDLRCERGEKAMNFGEKLKGFVWWREIQEIFGDQKKGYKHRGNQIRSPFLFRVQ
jgi:hypothetical protein